jgi:hypothetical protein
VNLIGLEAGTPFPGRSLATFWKPSPGTIEPEPTILIQASAPEWLPHGGREPVARGPMSALVARGKHYIRNGDGTEELYDLEADPGELHDLASDPTFLPELMRFRAALPAPAAGPRPQQPGPVEDPNGA